MNPHGESFGMRQSLHRRAVAYQAGVWALEGCPSCLPDHVHVINKLLYCCTRRRPFSTSAVPREQTFPHCGVLEEQDTLGRREG